MHMAERARSKVGSYGLCFLVGGVYGVIGQLIGTALEPVVGAGLAAPCTLLCLGVLAVLLYVPGIHQRIAAVSGFGSILPFNGFACGIADAFQAGYADGGGVSGGLRGVGRLFFHVIVLSSVVNMLAGVLAANVMLPKVAVPHAVPMPMAVAAGFVVAGLVCIAFQAVTDAGGFQVPNVLLVGQSLGGVLTLFGVTDVLAALGGYSFKILVMGAGQAVMATTALACGGSALMLLVTWGTFFALALFGIVAALLNLRLRAR
jgi:hypothetical protein